MQWRTQARDGPEDAAEAVHDQNVVFVPAEAELVKRLRSGVCAMQALGGCAGCGAQATCGHLMLPALPILTCSLRSKSLKRGDGAVRAAAT